MDAVNKITEHKFVKTNGTITKFILKIRNKQLKFLGHISMERGSMSGHKQRGEDGNID